MFQECIEEEMMQKDDATLNSIIKILTEALNVKNKFNIDQVLSAQAALFRVCQLIIFLIVNRN